MQKLFQKLTNLAVFIRNMFSLSSKYKNSKLFTPLVVAIIITHFKMGKTLQGQICLSDFLQPYFPLSPPFLLTLG